MANTDLAPGDEVLVPWGFEDDVRGIIQEIYGPQTRLHAVVLLTPDLSGSVVDEPSTVSMPVGALTKVASTAPQG